MSKSNTIILNTVSILTIIATLIGLTFAFFNSTISGTDEVISVTSAGNIGSIVFDGGSDFQSSENIEPGWTETRTITLTIPSGKPQEVLLKMDYTNDMPELQYKFILTDIMLGSTSEGTSSLYVTNDFSDNGELVTSTGTDFITLDSSNVQQTVTLTQVNTIEYSGSITLTYQFTMKLPETNIEQNENQGKLFFGSLYGELTNGTVYYNNSNPNGTTTLPTGTATRPS